jgi:hypothetical protein
VAAGAADPVGDRDRAEHAERGERYVAQPERERAGAHHDGDADRVRRLAASGLGAALATSSWPATSRDVAA